VIVITAEDMVVSLSFDRQGVNYCNTKINTMSNYPYLLCNKILIERLVFILQ